ncbi:DegT/DnrJ/EryC1/StrS family aminotransferase [Bowmanella denitrificans]|uniref:DegT/DnrJ/EryC1/StrS family aminotransferase n=1 Tax=Bowmanella denitrificans TaxID=366582 RepID=UPI000C9CFED6|nr:DegT/DnrJ/EryC1/StrS family aminotransferase [Bowmanella denitrificans]
MHKQIHAPIVFPAPLANASQFPSASIKAVPGFSSAGFSFFRRQKLGDDLLLTKHGRSALGFAATALKRPDRNKVLVPAYHCPALVEPFIWAGYDIVFYPLEKDLSVCATTLGNLLKEGATHCVVVNFFGCRKPDGVILEQLASAGIQVIEDYAHGLPAFFSHKDLHPAVAARICSVNKILPSIDGGLLKMRQLPACRFAPRSGIEELKAWLYLLGITEKLNRFRVKRDVNAATTTTEACGTLRYFDENELTQSGFNSTKLLVTHCNLDWVSKKRRLNYVKLLEALRDSGLGRPLYPELSDAIPYVLPFLLYDASSFETIRKQGIQILRWEEVAESDCQVSQHYRTHLIQIPCHQYLNQQEISMIARAFNGQ